MSLSSYNKVHVIANDDDIELQLTNKFSADRNIGDLKVIGDDGADFELDNDFENTKGNIRVISNGSTY